MNDLCTEDQETIREFLVESHENLSRLDQDLVELEKRPQDVALLGNIFRTIHTIKGACGFLAFSTLEGITHQAESLLSQLRDGKRELTPTLVSLILETVDATRKVLASIEANGKEGSMTFEDLTGRLRAVADQKADTKDQPAPLVPGQIESADSIGRPQVDQMPPAVLEGEQPTILGRDGDMSKGASKWDGIERRKQFEPKDEDVERHSAAADSNIRVGVGLLDKLMDLVGELVLTRNQILQFNTER